MNITATQLKQQTNLLLNVRNEEIIVTKRDKPFAVIIDFDRYNDLVRTARQAEIDKKLQALNSLNSYDLGGKNMSQIKAESDNA